MIEVDHLDKRFSGVHAVNDISLSIPGEEIFGLLGPNGAGKSTTIKMIVDVLQPDTGTIRFDGHSMDDEIRRQIGYLPEERGLYQKSGVLETIVHFGRLKGLDRQHAKSEATRWLERFDLADRADSKCEELSKGNQQKVQIVIALLHDPRYVILDEPTAGLDPVNQQLLREIILDLRKAGRVVVYSTHQMDLAERLCDRIALIHRGALRLQGEVETVRSEHGGNMVAVEFDGDGTFLTGLDFVKDGKIDGNQAELELSADAGVNDLFNQIGNRISVSRIERIRPSLNTIFIQTVGESDTPDEVLQSPASITSH